MNNNFKWLLWLCIFLFLQLPFLHSQSELEVPSRFDFGKMWTFEHAPLDYFEKTYGFKPDEEWLEHTRLSALRFASYCSASFISTDGLVITNHHCSRGEIGKVMQEGEDFDANGFYAQKLKDERQVPGLFVKQLVKIADITELVQANSDQAATEEALQDAKNQYQSKAGWEGLELETVTYYSGGRYSIYGYKRYDDVRLVLIPELQLGYFGGDPDNFTYPRYNLDYTIWRVYENGKPVNSKDFHFELEPKGPMPGDPIFAISNPGSTERYRTVAQLEYDRDYRYNILAEWLENRVNIWQEKYEQEPTHDLQEQIFNFSNGVKAYGGILDGLKDERLMGKKQSMETYVKSQSKAIAAGKDYWQQLDTEFDVLEEWEAERFLLSPNPLGGKAMLAAHYFKKYVESVEAEASEADLSALSGQLSILAQGLSDPWERKYLATLLKELQQFSDPGESYMSDLLKGRSPDVAAKEMLEDTRFTNEKKLEKLLEGKPKKLKKSKDPIAQLANTLVPRYEEASGKFSASKAKRTELEGKIANEVYQVYGLDIPPDATFTLRIADGVVKGYNYNGTKAPYKTTFFGLYDRYYANDGQFPWALPEKWLNPSLDLLKQPLNFISTADSIGGASGSPMVNKEGKLVGLLFDGNIESLPGNFIFDPTVNRSVGVHLGGVIASLKYIYKADRLLKELDVK